MAAEPQPAASYEQLEHLRGEIAVLRGELLALSASTDAQRALRTPPSHFSVHPERGLSHLHVRPYRTVPALLPQGKPPRAPLLRAVAQIHQTTAQALVLFLIVIRPPRSTLFPYTTLFR